MEYMREHRKDVVMLVAQKKNMVCAENLAGIRVQREEWWKALRMDEIDAYQAPDGLIELSPYLHVDHVPEPQQDRRRFRFTISPLVRAGRCKDKKF